MNTLITELDKSLKTQINNWGWSALLRGLVTLLFGGLVLVYPTTSMAVLTLFFGWFCLFEGLFLIFGAFTQTRDKSSFWATFLGGLLGILIGALVLWQPEYAVAYIVFFVAIWALMRGVTEIILAIEYRKIMPHMWLTIFTGILTAVLGIGLMWNWNVGAYVLIMYVGVVAVLIAIALLVLAFKLFTHKPLTSQIQAYANQQAQQINQQIQQFNNQQGNANNANIGNNKP